MWEVYCGWHPQTFLSFPSIRFCLRVSRDLYPAVSKYELLFLGLHYLRVRPDCYCWCAGVQSYQIRWESCCHYWSHLYTLGNFSENSWIPPNIPVRYSISYNAGLTIAGQRKCLINKEDIICKGLVACLEISLKSIKKFSRIFLQKQ